APQLAHFAVAAALELAPRLARLGGELGVLLHGGLAALVEVEQPAHRVVLEVDLRAPAPHRDDEPAELRAPVADVVDADDAVAEGREDASEGRAEDRGAQVPHVHGFRDVRAREVDEDRLTAALVGSAVAGALGGGEDL